MWPFSKKKKEVEQQPISAFDLEAIRNNRFIVNTDDAFGIPSWYVRGMIFDNNDKKLYIYLCDGILEINNELTSVIKLLREKNDNTKLEVTYMDGFSCYFYSEIFTPCSVESVVRSPINYSDDSLSIVCVTLKYDEIEYKFYGKNVK